jgi:glutathione S-transferase
MPTLYGSLGSPFVRKAIVALTEKGIAYEHDPVVPFGPNPEYRKISPLGKIPAFRDGDRTLADSSVIIAYLERTNPEPPLILPTPTNMPALCGSRNTATGVWCRSWARRFSSRA